MFGPHSPRTKDDKRTKRKTYNTRDSLVVTDPTTSLALRGLCLGERTGPSVFHELWSYVLTLPSSLTQGVFLRFTGYESSKA